MKSDMHPDYHQVNVKCACGATFKTGSTQDQIEVEICSKCHPFFTGEMKFVDTMGRVEKFQAKQAKAKKAPKKKKKSKSQSDDTDNQPKSLKEMLTPDTDTEKANKSK